MSPPELATDRPVVDVLHPVGIDLFEVARQDPRPAFPDRCQCARGKRRHANEPLDAEPRLDDRPAAIAVPDDHLVRTRVLEVAALAEPVEDRLAGLVSVTADELATGGVDPRLLVQHGDGRKPVALRDLVVVRIVGRRDLDRARPEGPLDVLVGNDRQAPPEEREDRVPTDERAVPIILRVDRDCRVAEERLGASGGHADPGAGIGRAVIALQVVADRPERARLVAVDVLEVADRRQAARAPVDQRLAAVDEPRVPQALEGDAHCPGGALVHGEALAAPVGRCAEAAVLRADDVPRLAHEVPHALQVPLATERGPGLPVLGDDPVEHELGADAGVIDARQPERIVAAHPVVADECVLHRGRQRVADVQRTGHVRRRLDHDEALSAGRRLVRGPECVGGQPALVDRRLDGRGVVARSDLTSRRRHRFRLLCRHTQKPVRRRTNGSWYHLRSRRRV